MNRYPQVPAVIALGTALAVLLMPHFNSATPNKAHCENCSAADHLTTHMHALETPNLAYQLTHNEAQALARHGWINASY